MFARVIADRYARALLDSCVGSTQIERVNDELATFRDVLKTNEDIIAFLLNPKIPPAVKKQVIERSLKDRFDPLLITLLKLLIDRRRQEIIPDIAERFLDLVDAVHGVEHAVVTTVVRLDDVVSERLKQVIQKFSDRTVDVKFETDPEIIGGIVIRMGDKVIDGSLATRFENIRRYMLAVRLPGISESGGIAENA